jgi:hypothetical protein
VRPYHHFELAQQHHCGTLLEDFAIDTFVCSFIGLILQVLVKVLGAPYRTGIADFHVTYGDL